MNGRTGITAGELLASIESDLGETIPTALKSELLKMSGDYLPRVQATWLHVNLTASEVLKANVKRATAYAYLVSDTEVVDELVRRERRKAVRGALMCNTNLSVESARNLAEESKDPGLPAGARANGKFRFDDNEPAG